MSNPLFEALGGNAGMPAPMANFQNMVQQFQRFKENFQGDPKAEVQKLLQSGRISQAQLNQLQELARQFSRLME